MTTDSEVFDFSSDNHQLFSPGGEVFGSFTAKTDGGASAGEGVAWVLEGPGGKRDFIVATTYGLRRVQTFNELLTALSAVGSPTAFPYADWPGAVVKVIA